MLEARQPQSRTIGAFLDEICDLYGPATAIVDRDRRYSFDDLKAESVDVARALVAAGIGYGDKVGILMGNRAEWLFVHFAASLIGAVSVGINTWSTTSELDYVLKHSGAKALIMAPRLLKHDYLKSLEELSPLGARFPDLETVVVLAEACPEGAVTFASFRENGLSIDPGRIGELSRQVASDDLVFLLYTSGSTSRPKGVLIQHAGLIDNMWHIGERMHVKPGEKLWLAVSLFWGFGCENAVYTMFTHGGCLVLQEHFDPEEALRLIETERCSIFYGLPNMIDAIMGHPEFEKRDLRCLRTGISMGSREQIKDIARRFLPEVTQSYGMTELYGNCSVCDCKSPVEVRATTGGRPLPGIDMRIVSPGTNIRLAAGEVGELRVKGHVTIGYHKDPELTAASFDDDGYFVTGDLGVIDAEGYFTFRGRLKDTVKTGGINVSPAEVEEILLTHESVLQTFVFGKKASDTDEELFAIVIPKEMHSFNEYLLKSYLERYIAKYKIPKRIFQKKIEDLPLTTTGKVNKGMLHKLV